MAGIDFSNGDAGTPGTMTELENEAPGCFKYLDQPYFADGGIQQAITSDPYLMPGYRAAALGQMLPDGGTDLNQLLVYYNMQSPYDLYWWQVGSEYTGSLQFQSRPAGRYGGNSPTGSWSYTISVPGGVVRCATGGDGGSCGAWPPSESADGSFDAWVDEIYDGIMATFSPSTPDLGQLCEHVKVTGPYGGHVIACLSVPNGGNGLGFLGVRPLRFYVEIADDSGNPTAMVKGFYGFMTAGYAGCSTPDANLELMDYGSLNAPFGEMSSLPLPLSYYLSNPFGLTAQELQSNFFCNGATAVDAGDPGYAAVSFGSQREITIEYNASGDQVNDAGVTNANVAYKIVGSSGYHGTSTFTAGTASDGGNDTYVLGVGTLTKNGSSYPVDWANPLPVLTELVNALYYGGPQDTSCADAASTGTGQADCVITTDVAGNHTVTFPFGAVPWFGVPTMMMTFAAGSGYPTTIGYVNAGGQ